MTPNEYQKLAARTLIETPDAPLSPEETMIIWSAFGVAGESGEIVDYLKKGIFHQHGYDTSKVEEELGDLLWYVTALATKLGLNMESIMDRNINKLKQRYPEGYSSEASINRKSFCNYCGMEYTGNQMSCQQCGHERD